MRSQRPARMLRAFGPALVFGTLALSLCAGPVRPQTSPVRPPESRPTTVDLRSTLIDMAAAFDGGAHSGSVRAQFDVFELELRERLADAPDARAKAERLIEYFFVEQALGPGSDLGSPEQFYVDKVFAGREGVCLALSSILLAVGQRLKLPLYGVAIPRHFFVRWDDGTTRRNIETLEGGRSLTDADYRRRGVTPEAERDGVFMRNLDHAETLAYLLNNEGYLYWARGQNDVAAKRFDQALAILPNLAEAWINRGVLAGERGDDPTAQASFSRALAWMPRDESVRLNRALTALRAGRYTEGLEDLDLAFAAKRGARAADYEQILAATILRPDNWKTFQATVTRSNAVAATADGFHPGLKATFFGDRDFKRILATRIDRSVEFEWRFSPPHPSVAADDWSARWEGFFKLEASGLHALLAAVEGELDLFVDGVRLLSRRAEDDALAQRFLPLDSGYHSLRLDYRRGRRAAALTFKIKAAGAAAALPERAFGR